MVVDTTGVIDTGGKFSTGVVDTGGKFATSVVDTGVHLDLQISPRTFEKNLNALNVICRGLGEDDS